MSLHLLHHKNWPYQTQEAPPEEQRATSYTDFYFPWHSCQVGGKRWGAICRTDTTWQSFWEELMLSNLGQFGATGRNQKSHKYLYQLKIAQNGELHQQGVFQQMSNYMSLLFYDGPWECLLFSDPSHHQSLSSTCLETFLLHIDACSKPFFLACQNLTQ